MLYAGKVGHGSVANLVHNMIGHSVRQAIAGCSWTPFVRPRDIHSIPP